MAIEEWKYPQDVGAWRCPCGARWFVDDDGDMEANQGRGWRHVPRGALLVMASEEIGEEGAVGRNDRRWPWGGWR